MGQDHWCKSHGRHCHKFRAFCWSEYSDVWSYTDGQGHTRVAHWDSLNPCKPLFSCFGSVQQTASGASTELQRAYRASIDGATLPYGIARWIWHWSGWQTFDLSSHVRSSDETVISGTPHWVPSHASTAILTFTVLIIQSHEKKNTRRSWRILRIAEGTRAGTFSKIILELLLKTGAAILFTLITILKQEN